MLKYFVLQFNRNALLLVNNLRRYFMYVQPITDI